MKNASKDVFSLSIREHPVQVPLTVQWGEMDAFEHVNNAVYFRYFETARIAYFLQTGVINSSSSVGPILAKADCTFIFPLRYPDDIICTARTLEVMSDRFRMQYRVYSKTHQRLAAKGTGLIVSYDYESGSKVDVPLSWRDGIAALQSDDSSLILQ